MGTVFRLISKKSRIKRKLIMINLLTTGLVLLLTGSALMLSVYVSFRAFLFRNLTTQARILANDTTASLTFNDQKSGENDLYAFKASPGITRGIIYDRYGRVFAEYLRPGFKKDLPPPVPGSGGNRFADNYLHIFQDVELDGEKIGTIYLSSDLGQVHSLMLRYGQISAITIAIVFALAFLMLTRLQRVITGPLSSLARSMQMVTREKNYAYRADIFDEDEIGDLAKGFNEMLEQIQERDVKLRAEIAERKQAGEELKNANSRVARLLRFSEALLSAIPTPVFYKDNEGRYLGCNSAFTELTGFTPEQIKGKSVMELWPAEFAEFNQRKDQELMKEPARQVYEYKIRDKSGMDHTAMFVKDVFRDENGQVAGIVGAFLDITERMRAEESIRKLNEDLEQKIQERTRQLLDAQEELIRKEKLAILGQLSGSVGHELRNPLGVINNAVYYLKTVMTDADESVKEYLDIIKNEIDGSQRIIADLLDFARTKSPQKKDVGVRELIESSIGRSVIPENVNLRTETADDLPALRVDPLQMRQVFENLIINAVHAMPGGGELRITARPKDCAGAAARCGRPVPGGQAGSPRPEMGGYVEISVIDTGEGIAEENVKKLFQPLFTTKARGIGLGLTVCRNLTEANGGEITVASRLGAGTVFKVTLPVAEDGK